MAQRLDPEQDPDGEPIAAAIVYVQAPSGELLAAAGTTGEDGLASFSKLPAGVTWVQAERVGYSLPEFATDTNGRQQLTLANGDNREVHLTLTPSADNGASDAAEAPRAEDGARVA